MSEMKKQECPRFEACSAALCPLDPNPRHFWFADTEICGAKPVKAEFIKTQRKIAKINPDPHSYYTRKMIEQIKRVKPGIRGITRLEYSRPMRERAEKAYLESLAENSEKKRFVSPDISST